MTLLGSDVSSYKRMKTAEDIILQSVINFIEIGVNYLCTQDVLEYTFLVYSTHYESFKTIKSKFRHFLGR